MHRTVWACVCLLVVLTTVEAHCVPVIYCTDLFHPHDDPDDHFDLATLFALPELDVRAIILDQGAKQLQRPGSIPIQQLCAITGRRIPWAIGLDERLESPNDTGISRPVQFQAGVEAILQVLRQAKTPVTIVQTGSLRDLAAAYNRQPELLRSKVARLYVNSGNAEGTQFEYNAQLDPIAYRRVMESDLPLYWCPCFGGSEAWSKGPHGAWWQFRQGELFDRLSPRLLSYFAYALMCLPSSVDPVAAVRGRGISSLISADWRAQTWEQQRSMWSTASLLHAANRREKVFSFEPMAWEFDNASTVSLRPTAGDIRRVLTIPDEEAYAQVMFARLSELLSKLGGR